MKPYPIFSIQKDRLVYECPERKKWRCPSCLCWREWEEEECAVCHVKRDGD